MRTLTFNDREFVADHIISLTIEDFQGGSYIVLEVDGNIYREVFPRGSVTETAMVGMHAARFATSIPVLHFEHVVFNTSKVVSFSEHTKVYELPILTITMTNGKNWVFNGDDVNLYTTRLKQAIAEL